MTGRQTRVEDWAPWVAGLLLAAPVLVAYYPPMTDLPFHEGLVGLLRHAGDPLFEPPGLYERNLGEPNQLFHMTGWALSYLVSTRWAAKLIVAAAVTALPVAAARFARHLGASPLAALVVAPMALGWLFSWGLIANLIGLSALLATLPVFDRLAAEPTPRRAAGALAATVLLYFGHMAMMFVSSGVALGLCVLHPWSWRKAPLRLSPFVAGAAITLAQTQWQKQFITPALHAVIAIPTMWRPLSEKLSEVAEMVEPSVDPPVKYAMMGLCALTIGSLAWLRVRERRADRAANVPAPAAGSRFERLRAWALLHRWELVALSGFAAFLTFPAVLNGATLVYHRWFPPAFAILAVVVAPRDLWVPAARTARMAAYTLPVATLVVAAPSFVDSNREYKNVEALIARIEPGSAVAEVDLGPGDPSRTYSTAPAYARALAERGGRMVYAFTDSPISPMVLQRDYEWNETLVRIGWDSWHFSPRHDLRRFRYVVMRARDPLLKWMASFAIAEEARLVDEDGDWVLFESKLPVVPLTSPDVPPPNPKNDTMRERIAHVKDMLRATRPDVDDVEVPPETSKAPEGDHHPPR
jgi:hypothetical protein